MSTMYARFHEKGEGRALIELAKNYDPKSALREFVTNGIDSILEAKGKIHGDISVVINPKDRRIIVSDNALGIPSEKFMQLPLSIGYSEKADMVDMRGEKALGLLAFGSLGKSMHMITRPYGLSAGYDYLRWELKESKAEIPCTHENLSSTDVQDFFYGTFNHGTRIVVDQVDPHILKEILTKPNLKNWLRELYNPALRKRVTKISLGTYDKRSKTIRTEELEPIEYQRNNSTELINTPADDLIEITIKGQDEPGKLEVLLFVDPEATTDKVAVYSKDVLVYQSLALLPEFVRSAVWTSGKVVGYINDYFNKLVLGREAIDRNRNAFKAWFTEVQNLEKRIAPVVEQKKKHGKRLREERHLKTAYNAVADALKDLKKTDLGDRLINDKDGEIVETIGIQRISTNDNPGTGENNPTNRNEEEVNTNPPIISGPGEKVRVRRKPETIPRPIPNEFPLSEAHLRSKLETSLGEPILYVNSAHEDYKLRVSVKDHSVFVKYSIELMAKEAAGYEIQKLSLEGRLKGDPSDLVSATLLREEQIRFLAMKRLGLK